MYLTRLEINPRRRAARALLVSPHRIHAAVLAAFPDGHARSSRVLWRTDEGAHDTLLYLVSTEQPDLTHLVENAGLPTRGWQTREYGPFLDRLDSGDRWAFRLTANPVHNATPVERGVRGKRFAHVTVAQQSAWFLRHAERRGMRVLESSAGEGERDLVLHSRRTLRFARGSQTVTLTTAVFEGHAEVTDPAALRAALVGGIGPAKGYGCGLMTLATT